MRSLFTSILVGAFLIGFLAFFLNVEQGQHFIGDFLDMFKARQIEQEAKDIRQESSFSEEAAEANRQQVRNLHQLLQEKNDLLASKIEQGRVVQDRFKKVKSGENVTDFQDLKEMIRVMREADNRLKEVSSKISEQESVIGRINELMREQLEYQKESQRTRMEKAGSDMERNRDRVDNHQERMQERAISQQEQMKSKMEALRERMQR